MSAPLDAAGFAASQEGGKRPPTIVIFYTSSFAGLLSPLARHLRKECGYRVILMSTYKRLLPSPKFYDFDTSDFDEVHFCGDLLAPRGKDELPSASELAERSWRLEERFGVSALDLVRVDRMIGIDFVTGADFHRAKIGKLCSHDQAIDIALRLAGYMEEHLVRLRPVAIIGYPGSVFTNALISIGESMGIPMRYLWPPRRGNLYSWICNRWGWHEGLKRFYDEELAALLKGGGTDMEPAAAEVSQRFLGVRNALQQEARLGYLMARMYRHIRKNLPDLIRGRQPLYDSYLIREKLRLELQHWRLRRRILLEKAVFPTFSDDLPFVFFPLHMEPEISLMVECARADNQLVFIDWLAKSLPGGWRLLVKEHPAQASDRMPGFWEQVRRYPNVEVLGTLERAEDIFPKARAVAVINSTVGFQAANLGLPVLTFHRHYLPRLMPHVRFCQSFEDTRVALRAIAGGAGPSAQYRAMAARAFDRALARSEFPITNSNMLAGRSAREPMAKAEFESMVDHLLASLAPSIAPDGTAGPEQRIQAEG